MTAPAARLSVLRRACRTGRAKGRERFGFRLIEASVQGNHLHFIVEAEDPQGRTDCGTRLGVA